MAETKGNIQKPDPDEHGTAVQSVTTNVSHPADADSSPGPYVVDGEPMPIERPGVSTARPDGDVAHSLVAGAGAPTGEADYIPLESEPPPAKVTKADNVEKPQG